MGVESHKTHNRSTTERVVMKSKILPRLCLLVASLMEGPKTETQLQQILSPISKGVIRRYLGFFHFNGVIYLSGTLLCVEEGDRNTMQFSLQKQQSKEKDFLPTNVSLHFGERKGYYATVNFFVRVFVLLMTKEARTAQKISALTGSKDETIWIYLKAMHAKKIIYFVDTPSRKLTDKGKTRKCIERIWKIQPSLGAFEDVGLRKPRIGKSPARESQQQNKRVLLSNSTTASLPRPGWIPTGFC